MNDLPLITGVILHEEIGRGATSVVFRATDNNIGRDVAVKVPSASVNDERLLESWKSVIREAQASSRIEHPGVVRVYQVGLLDGTPAIVMELVRGRTLAQVLADEGALSVERAMPLVHGLLEVLAAAHNSGVVHRDVKPSNAFVEQSGLVRLGDFGLALLPDASTQTATGALVGTLGYLAPEQALGRRADKRSDVFSAGVVAYELLTGANPFVREGDGIAAVLARIVRDDVPSPRSVNKGVPRGVSQLIHRAICRPPDMRYPDAGAMLAALKDSGNWWRSVLLSMWPTLYRRRVVLAAGLGILAAATAVPLLLIPAIEDAANRSGQGAASSSKRDVASNPTADVGSLEDGLHVNGLALLGAVSQSKVLGTFGTEDERYGPSPEGEVYYAWTFQDGSYLTVGFDQVGSLVSATLAANPEGTGRGRLADSTYAVLDGRRVVPGQDTLASVVEWFPGGQMSEVSSMEGSYFVDYSVPFGGEGSELMKFSLVWTAGNESSIPTTRPLDSISVE
jgi:serine/threonine protein kinase